MQIIGVLVVVLIVGVLVLIVVNLFAWVAFIVTIPSLAVMRLIRSWGLTDPGWYVVLHALLGAAIGIWAPRISRLFQRVRRRLPKRATSAVDKSGSAPRPQNVRQRPLREVAVEIWANRRHRLIAISILVFLVLISC